MNCDCEVLIIGAGPAGSSAAAILAEQGRRVLVLEREKFPRQDVEALNALLLKGDSPNGSFGRKRRLI